MRSRGKYFWRQEWYSVCSRHHDYSEDCRICNKGAWVNTWELSIDHQATHPNGRKYQRHIRPAGIWRPIHGDFIILIGCEKSGKIYTPLNAFDTAMTYRTDFEIGLGGMRERI